MKSLLDLLARKPWLLIILGFLLLISIWVIFFTLAVRNQPERLPLSLPLNQPAETLT